MNPKHEIPKPEEYCELRKTCGLALRNVEAAKTSLPHSLFSVCIRDKEKLIAMARVVGDGLHVQVVDIAVHPEYQKRGLGRIIMEEVMKYIRAKIDPMSNVSLFADNDWLYQKFGFEIPAKSQGMFLKKLKL